MSTKNLIKKNTKFDKEYIATVVSNEDPLLRGRLLVKIDTLLGDIPFWVDATLVAGSVRLTLIPEKDDIVSVKFKNKDIYSGEWELKGSPNDKSNIDPKKYGLSDAQGNFIIIDRTTNNISINSTNDSVITAVGAATINCENAVINATSTTINGKLTVTGECTFEGIKWKSHVHPYTWTDGAGSGDTKEPK